MASGSHHCHQQCNGPQPVSFDTKRNQPVQTLEGQRCVITIRRVYDFLPRKTQRTKTKESEGVWIIRFPSLSLSSFDGELGSRVCAEDVMLLSHLILTKNPLSSFHKWGNMLRWELTSLNAQSWWVQDLSFESREPTPKSLTFITDLHHLQFPPPEGLEKRWYSHLWDES